MACGDHHGHPHPLPSKENQVRWHVETIMVIHTLYHPETIKSDGMRRPSWSSAPFVIQRQSSPMACRDHRGHSFLLFSRLFQSCLPSRDKQVHWHVETINVFCSLSFSKATRVLFRDFDVSLTLQDFKVLC